jgi:cell division protein FtsW (lipid II flippase)
MKFDFVLVLIIFLLSIFGLVFFYNLSITYSLKVSTDKYLYFKKFFLNNFLVPILFFFIANFLGWRFFQRWAKIIFIISFLFLVLPFFDYFKLPEQNTARWFYLKFFNFSFQPSEFIKFSLILFLSSVFPLIKKNKEYFLISLFIIAIVIGLVYLQPALSTTLIIISSLIGGFMGSNFSLRSFFILFLIVIIILSFSFMWSYRLERIKNIFNFDEKNIGYQLKQSRLAIGSGGILGKGLGKSEVKLIHLPLMISDNIFSIYAEEFGFIGSIFLILVFLILIFRIFNIGINNKNDSQKFFIFAIGCWLSSQVFIHIISNLLITTGVPLPFFSYGPSSQLALMVSLGIINSLK